MASAFQPTSIPEKTGKDLSGRFNRFLQSAKPERLLKGRRRTEPEAEPDPTPELSLEARLKAERYAAQVAEYEQRLEEWNEELRRKKRDAELHDVPFNEEEDMPSKPVAPAPLVDTEAEHGEEEATISVLSQTSPVMRASTFRPIVAPVVAEGQRASEVAELFATKAYGSQLHPAATPTPSAAVSARNPLFSASSGPMLPPSATTDKPATFHSALEPSSGYSMPLNTVDQSSPPPPFAPYATRAGVAPSAYGAVPHAMAPPVHTIAAPLPQSVTYVDPALAERIRRGRELERLGISEEERGNMGHAKEAYMKALELLIPAIPMLDHGNDVSHAFRSSEKRKLNREAGLMLDRCEEIKRFLESDVALNTRNLLDSAKVPQTRPKTLTELRREQQDGNDFDVDSSSKGGLGLKKKPAVKRKVDVPPLPSPPSELLDGLASLSLSDPTLQQAHPPLPAPIPPALPSARLHGASASHVSSVRREQMLSRPPPSDIPPPAPALPSPPADEVFADVEQGASCDVCRTNAAKLVSKCNHNFCAQCMNKAATFQFCLHPDCHEQVGSSDFQHLLE